MSSHKIAIGIDLGTTYSCVGVFQNDKIEIIAFDQDQRIIPSYVAFNENERLIGDAAKQQMAVNPTNTVFGVKRLIGREFDDPVVKSDMSHWPFTVINDNGHPRIQVQFKGQKKSFLPEEISAMILGKIKDTAEAYLGQPVSDAVITIPAYFNANQRQATIDAAAICGLNVLRIINEPTAAGIAYGLDKKVKDSQNILIFDLGGGTFDVSILKMNNGNFEVKAAAGNSHLGGEDFDKRLLSHFVQEIKQKFKKDLTDNKRAIRRLWTACEFAKKTLSSNTYADISIDCLFDGEDFSASISRARFEDLCSDLFRSTLEPVKKVLQDSGLKKDNINEIVLVGGSTRIPKIQQLLREFFTGKELNLSINADEAVAYGAAVQAAIMSEVQSKAVQDIMILEVTPLSLGVEVTKERKMSTVIKRNTPIPVKQKRNYTTMDDDQTTILFQIYEGEDESTKNNTLLGKFRLNGIPPAPKGKASVDVTFDIDANGILHVQAVDAATGNANNIKITCHSGRPSKQDVERMIEEARKYKAEDLAYRERRAEEYSVQIRMLTITKTSQ
ncbi:Heat shock cognate 71 kDa protein [Cichlidogyrus casuarinus]|uniref:Heat shock cognate 71 kDa protein n=1 Tax=Cichlidogyrus casuarinus TaxID=1844966 RepID=A0ABD2Q3H3_9PLAT